MQSIHPILFIASSPNERPAKLALGLRRYKIPIMMLYVNVPSYDLLKYFNYAIKCDDALECVTLARRLNPKVIHVFSWHADSVALLLVNDKFTKIVYDYKDTFENMVGSSRNPHLWAAQRHLIENADGLCCRDLQMAQYLRVNNVLAKGRKIYFPDYCWNEDVPPKSNINPNEVHVVLIGTFMIEKVDPVNLYYGYAHIIKLFVLCGIHVHVYPSFNTHNIMRSGEMGSDYFDIEKNSNFLCIHDPLPVDRIVYEISQYDFGLLISQGALFGLKDEFLMNNADSYGVATRIFDYLEAGLEIITQTHTKLTYRVLNQKKVAINLTKEFVLDIVARRAFNELFNLLYERKLRSKKAAYEAREYYAVDKHIPRLIGFYERVMG